MPYTDELYDSWSGVTIKRFWSGLDLATADAALGTTESWKLRVRGLFYDEPTLNVGYRVIHPQVFYGLTVEIYDSLYVGGINNPVDGINSAIRTDTSGLTRAIFPGIIGIALVVGTNNTDENHLQGILAREFGLHTAYRCNMLTGTGRAQSAIQAELWSGTAGLSFVELRTSILGGDTTYITVNSRRFAEDYRYLFGGPSAQGTFTPTSYPTPNMDNNTTLIDNTPKFITLLKCAYSLQKYLHSRTYDNLTLQNSYFQWELTQGDFGVSGDKLYQALDNNLVWYDWSNSESRWIPVGSDTPFYRGIYSSSAPVSTPV